MQGMITGFRMSALRKVKGFTTGHLIEDYDITARLKKIGWKVKIANKAFAWTTVPEDFESFWKQRVRWTYGGLKVVSQFWKNTASVFQDLMGHTMFLILLLLVIISFILNRQTYSNAKYALALIIVGFLHFTLSTTYSLIVLKTYKDRDKWDWILKLSIIPEFVYSNVLSLVLLGSYLFYTYQLILSSLASKFVGISHIYNFGLSIFHKIGYSSTWGTKEISKKGGIDI
jgi:hypothetical protein